MIEIDFTLEEQETLRYERFYYPNPLVQKKFEVLLLKSYGYSTSEIAEIMGVTTNTVRNHFYEYIEGGIERLKENRYKGQPSVLSNHAASIEDDFRRDPPSTVAEAADRIEKMTGVRRGLTQTRQFMKRMGMSFRKVGPVPAKADATEQEEFKKNTSLQGFPRPQKGNGWSFS